MEIVGLLPFVLWIGIWLWALFDAVSFSVWLLLIFVLQFFGTLFYFWQVRPKLLDAGGRG